MRTLHSSQAVRVREDEAFQARLAERRECLRASDAVGTVPDPTGPPPARRWAPLPSSSSSSSSSTLQDPAPSAGPRPRPWFSSVSAPNPGPAPAPSPAATAAAATAAAAAGAEGVAGPSSSEDVSPPSPPTESLAVPIEYELEQYLPGDPHLAEIRQKCRWWGCGWRRRRRGNCGRSGPLTPIPLAQAAAGPGLGAPNEKKPKEKPRVSLMRVCLSYIYIWFHYVL